jgi:hypothetical protein
MVLLASAAHAHGGVGMRDNRCVLRIGPDIMFFTGYQPQNSRDEFCDDIPTTGQTVVALDMQDSEFRDMLTEIRIIRDEGNHTTMNGLPFLTDAELGSPQVPAQDVSHGHPENGKFIGIVTVKNTHGHTYVSQFPFSVGQRLAKAWESTRRWSWCSSPRFTCFGTWAGSRSPFYQISPRERVRMHGSPVFAEIRRSCGPWP